MAGLANIPWMRVADFSKSSHKCGFFRAAEARCQACCSRISAPMTLLTCRAVSRHRGDLLAGVQGCPAGILARRVLPCRTSASFAATSPMLCNLASHVSNQNKTTSIIDNVATHTANAQHDRSIHVYVRNKKKHTHAAEARAVAVTCGV